MHHIQLIEKFYTAFQNKDAKGMTTCYHQDLMFKDPAFGELDYKRACAMWEMLLGASKDLEITFSDIQSDENKGTVRWEAKYSFSKTGRKVHNKINTKFTFKDGLILKHKDEFNFYKWSKMALGTPGILLGWTSFLQNKVKKQANKSLDKHLNG